MLHCYSLSAGHTHPINTKKQLLSHFCPHVSIAILLIYMSPSSNCQSLSALCSETGYSRATCQCRSSGQVHSAMTILSFLAGRSAILHKDHWKNEAFPDTVEKQKSHSHLWDKPNFTPHHKIRSLREAAGLLDKLLTVTSET